MPSIRLLHYTHKVYKDGTSPIILQIISGKTIKKKTLASVLPEQWDDSTKRVKVKKHPNYASINSTISTQFNKYEKMIMDAAQENRYLDVANIFEGWKGQKVFSEIADLFLKGCSPFTRKTNKSHIDQFKEYLGREIHLPEITHPVIEGFKSHMQSLGNVDSTIATKLSTLRSVSSYAVDKLKYQPAPGLKDMTLPSRKSKPKVKLNQAELDLLASAQLVPGSMMAQARDAFLLAFYCGGMRVSDIIQLKKDSFKDGRYHYVAQKTGKVFNFPIQPKAQEIVNRNGHGDYVFSFFKFQPDPFKSDEENEKALVKHINSKTTQINNNLRRLAKDIGLKKHLTTHVNRHSFANMADEKLGGDLRKLQTLFKHGSRKTTEDYIGQIRESDEMDKDMGSVYE